MNEYWRQREEQAQLEYQLTDDEYVDRLQDIYDYTLDQVNKEISGFYSKYASQTGITIADAKKKVSQLDIEEYERKAKKYVEEKNFTAKANEEMRLYNLTMKVNRLEMLKADIGLEMVNQFMEIEDQFKIDLSERVQAEFRRQAGILGNSIANNAKTANELITASFHNATFSDRIWMYQSQMKAELANLLEEGLVQGRNPRELARHMNRLFDTGKYNCERLLRTELCRVQTSAQMASFIANGFTEYQFNALGNACRDCLALDEQHFKVADAMPGENCPPIHPNCRCATSAWMDDELFNQWLDSYKDHGMDYQDWLENRPAEAEQDNSWRNYDCSLAQSLGKTRYDELCDLVEACPDENLKNLWKKYQSEIIVGDAHYKGTACEWAGRIYFNADKDTIDSNCNLAYQTIFHEGGHAIDFLASKTHGMYSTGYDDGKFYKTIKGEVDGRVNEQAKYIKQLFKDDAGNWEVLVAEGYISPYNYSRFEETGHWIRDEEPKYSKSMAYHDVEKSIREYKSSAKANTSDIYEGATRSKIQAGYGHAKSYWKNQDNVALEAFAEFCDASFANSDSLETMKTFLPESYKAWQEIIEEMLKEE